MCVSLSVLCVRLLLSLLLMRTWCVRDDLANPDGEKYQKAWQGVIRALKISNLHEQDPRGSNKSSTGRALPTLAKTKFGHRVLPSLTKPSVANTNLRQTHDQVWQDKNWDFFKLGTAQRSNTNRAATRNTPQHREGPTKTVPKGDPEPRNIGWGPNGGARTHKIGAPKGGAPHGGATRKGGHPKGWGAQKFALFSPLPPQFSFFLPSLGGLLVEFWWCFEAPGLSNVHVRSSRAVVCVKPRREP